MSVPDIPHHVAAARSRSTTKVTAPDEIAQQRGIAQQWGFANKPCAVGLHPLAPVLRLLADEMLKHLPAHRCRVGPRPARRCLGRLLKPLRGPAFQVAPRATALRIPGWIVTLAPLVPTPPFRPLS
eukprot:1745142-Rhodomonas_salina.1